MGTGFLILILTNIEYNANIVVGTNILTYSAALSVNFYFKL